MQLKQSNDTVWESSVPQLHQMRSVWMSSSLNRCGDHLMAQSVTYLEAQYLGKPSSAKTSPAWCLAGSSQSSLAGMPMEIRLFSCLLTSQLPSFLCLWNINIVFVLFYFTITRNLNLKLQNLFLSN